jgi:hypothetical protein
LSLVQEEYEDGACGSGVIRRLVAEGPAHGVYEDGLIGEGVLDLW